MAIGFERLDDTLGAVGRKGPLYKADGLLQVEEKKSGLGDLDINALFEGDTSINAEIEILRSRSVLGAVVDNLNLDINAEPEFFPIFGAAIARMGDESDRPDVQIIKPPNTSKTTWIMSVSATALRPPYKE